MNKQQQLWKLAQDILETHDGLVGKLQLCESNDCDVEFNIKIYHGNGYCWELQKQVHCEPDEVEDYYVTGLEKDGCLYHFTEPWDGFTETGIDKAVEELSIYTKAPLEQ